MTTFQDNNKISNRNDFNNFRYVKENLIEKRDYQFSIAEKCVNKNSLVVLPTGLGKTIIALLVAAKTLEYFPPESKIIFLAPTRPLINQHYSFFLNYFSIPEKKFIILTGKTSPKERPIEFSKNQLLFFTPQTLRNDVVKQKYDLSKVCLMIFDEAHHATGDYAYVYLAREYMNQNSEGNILALTASPGASKELIEELCKVLYVPLENIHVRTRTDSDVKSYIKPMNIVKMGVSLTEMMRKALSYINEILNERVQYLGRSGFINTSSSAGSENFNKKIYRKKLVEMRNELLTLSNQPGSNKGIFSALSAVAQCLILYHMESLIEQQGLDILLLYLEKLKKEANKKNCSKARRIIAEDRRVLSLFKELSKISQSTQEQLRHPKINLLIRILIEQLSKNNKSRILIFVKLRDSVKNITKRLKEVPEIKAKRFVGQASKGEEKGLSQKDQIRILEEFKKGKYNILVSTNVGEEGLDIAECDLVIFYDVVASEIRLIQRKGRTARHKEGKVIILYTKETNDELYLHIALNKLRIMQGNLKKAENSLASFSNQKMNGSFFPKEKEHIINEEPSHNSQVHLQNMPHEVTFKSSKTKKKRIDGPYIHQSRLTSFIDKVSQENALIHLKKSEPVKINAKFPMNYGIRKEFDKDQIAIITDSMLMDNDIVLFDKILIRILKPQNIVFHDILIKNRTLKNEFDLIVWAVDFISFQERIEGEKEILKNKLKTFGQNHEINIVKFDCSEELHFIIKNLFSYNQTKKIV